MSNPEGQGGGDSIKWNYAYLMAPTLGLAAFKWIWSKRFEKKLMEERYIIRLETEIKTARRFQEALEKENEQEHIASEALKEVEYRLIKRQELFCSNFVRYTWNTKMEDELLAYVAKEPLTQLKMEDGLRDIFQNDRTCAEYLNTDPRRNGSLMWLYLRYWQQQLTLQSHQRAESAILNTDKKVTLGEQK